MNKFLFLLGLAGLLACGAPAGDQQTNNTEESTTAAAPEETPAVAKLEIEGNDQMQYNLKTLEVKAGQKVELTLNHVGKMTIEAMGHNWVLLKPGTDVAAFATASIAAKDNDYIAPDQMDSVIAHTKMLGGGESDTITFDAPEAGTYTFICTFPGHYALMKGEFIVSAD